MQEKVVNPVLSCENCRPAAHRTGQNFESSLVLQDRTGQDKIPGQPHRLVLFSSLHHIYLSGDQPKRCV